MDYPDILRKAIEQAEALFGPCSEPEQEYRIEFIDGINSQFQHPNTIRLSNHCRDNPSLATYVLAHEGIHALSVSPYGPNWLEEGIAESFSIAYARSLTGTIHQSHPKYRCARKLVNRLLRPDLVKRMRLEEPRIGLIDAQLVLKHAPHVRPEEAYLLATKFSEST